MHDEIRIEARIRNNVLWHAIFDTYGSVAEFCREFDLSGGVVGSLLNLKETPLKKNGEYRPFCIKMADLLGYLPDDLFPRDLYKIKEPKRVLEVPLTALAGSRTLPLLPPGKTPYEKAVDSELRRTMQATLRTLTSKEEFVLRQRFFKDETLEEIGRKLDLTRESVRRIETNALTKLRKKQKLRPFVAK